MIGRPAKLADIEALLRIESAWSTTPHWTRTHFEREIGNPISYLAVFEEEGPAGPLGYGGLRSLPPEGQITNLAVRPDAARRGIGGKILAHLLKRASALGLDRVTLEADAENAPALRLYKRAGFIVVGRRPKFYNGVSDAILMELALP